MSIAMRERERDRDWDSRSFGGGGGGGGGGDRPSRVTVRRYQVPDRDEDDRFETSSRVTGRNNLDTPRRSEFRETSNVREFKYEREVERDRAPDRDLYDYRSERARSPPGQYRDRSPSGQYRDSSFREIRIDREVSRDPPRRETLQRDRDYDLDHYTKTTDYYARQEAPQPIIIRQDAPQPIIIREPAPQPLVIREERAPSIRAPSIRAPSIRSPSPKSVMMERQSEHEERHTEINEERTVARRDPSPEPPARQEEDEYYYQRTTREIARREDDYDDYRRRRPRRRDSPDQFSEDDYYYKKTVEGGRARSSSRKRLELAGGAVAGLGAAALLNHRRKADGERSGGVKNLAAGAAVGTAGAELIRRARSNYRGKSESRSRSRSREYERAPRRRRRREYSESRSRSRSREGPSNLAKLGAVAAIGAIAGYAASRRGKNKDKEVVDDRRSRSRRRRDSRGRSISSSRSDSARDPKTRNTNIAKAGLASAAVAGLVDRVRSKSTGGARSKSRVRTGAPIAVAGLGGAALAGLYENQKAKKEPKRRDRSVSGSRSPRSRERSRARGGHRDRTRSRSAPAGYADARGPPHSDQNLIEYGDDPIGPGGNVYERPHSRNGSMYNEHVRRRGSPGSSNSASPRRRRYADPSQSRDPGAEGAAGAGIAGVAAHEASKRRERKRAERERRRQEEAAQESPQAHGGTYGFGPYGQEPPPAPIPPPNEYAEQPYFPQGNAYPPPSNAYSPVPNFVGQGPQPPHDYGAHPGYAPQQGAPAPDGYGYQPPGHGGPYHPNVSDVSINSGQGRTDVNELHPTLDLHLGDEGRRHSKTVAFDLTPAVSVPAPVSPQLSPRSLPTSPEHSPTYDGTASRQNEGERSAQHNLPYDENEPASSSTSLSNPRGTSLQYTPYRRRRARRTTESAEDMMGAHGEAGRWQVRRQYGQARQAPSQQDGHDSEETVSLPDRFDEHGRRMPDGNGGSLDEVGQESLRGQMAARLFEQIAHDMLGGGNRRG